MKVGLNLLPNSHLLSFVENCMTTEKFLKILQLMFKKQLFESFLTPEGCIIQFISLCLCTLTIRLYATSAEQTKFWTSVVQKLGFFYAPIIPELFFDIYYNKILIEYYQWVSHADYPILKLRHIAKTVQPMVKGNCSKCGENCQIIFRKSYIHPDTGKKVVAPGKAFPIPICNCQSK